MDQLSLDFSQPTEPGYRGPCGFITQARGEFIRNCQTLRGSDPFNWISEASWGGWYQEHA